MSKDINIDGQLNFLEMMGAYTDSSGASISVSKPRTEIKGRKTAERSISVKDSGPIEMESEQLSFSLDIISIGDSNEEPVDSGIVVKELDKIEIETRKSSENSTLIIEPEPEPAAEEPAPEPAAEEPALEPVAAVAPEPTAETPEPAAEEPEPEPVVEASVKRAPKLKKKSGGRVELFDKCSDCWCSDCKHNSQNEGKPREMCGMMMACPACEACIEQGYAEVCEIGSAKEGCKTRAIEEGLFVEEESV